MMSHQRHVALKTPKQQSTNGTIIESNDFDGKLKAEKSIVEIGKEKKKIRIPNNFPISSNEII